MRGEEEAARYRHARLQGLILEELRALLRDDVSDPALESVQIATVVLSVDYRHARIHFTIRGSEDAVMRDRPRIEKALARATPFFRANLADAVEIKRIPDLRFVFDSAAIDDDDFSVG